jgi:predicted porin
MFTHTLKLTAIAAALASPLFPTAARADDVSDLKQQIRILSDRLSAIEKERAATPTTSGVSEAQPAPVTISYPPSMVLVKGPDTVVSLYGVVDLTLASQTNADAAGHRGSGMVVSWMSGNRFGIDASHVFDKERGLKVIARLENEFELPTGNLDTPNVLFNRDAWVGVQSDDIGKLTLGRQNTLPRDFAQTWGEAFGSREVDLGEGGWNNNNQMQYMINYAGGATGTRYDSGVVWKKKTGQWVTGLAYQFNGGGGYVPGNTTTNTTKAAAVAYNGGAWNVSGTASFADVAGFKHQVVGIGGNFQIMPMVVARAGYFHNSADQAVVGSRKDNVFTTSVTFTPTEQTQFDLGYYTVHAKNAGYAGSGNTLGVNSDTSSVTAAADGNFHTLYGAAFYRWDRHTDVYVAADTVHTGGGFKLGFTHGFASATEFGTGLRFKF